MAKYKVRLADDESYPYESFDCLDEATQTAHFRAANHQLAFEVLGPDPRDTQLPLIILNRVEPHNQR